MAERLRGRPCLRPLPDMKSLCLLMGYHLQNLCATSPIVDTHARFDLVLTSHSSRVPRAYAAIESICAGPVRPRRVILFLARDDWPLPLPATLKRLVSRGLEVLTCENLGPHKKQQPYLRMHARFDRPLVTIDDDVFYRSDLLMALLQAWLRQPDVIHCSRARQVRLQDHGFAPYTSWPLCDHDSATFANFATGVGGVIYPPGFLAALKAAGSGFREACPWADDIWVNKQAVSAGFKVRQLRDCSDKFTDVPGARKTALFKRNIRLGGNDRQLAHTYSAEDLQRISLMQATQ
ncbi:hypothetical protein [Aquabacterium sp.]|uniref:hypothetical protein n=1 Tax=Aquabacterium sp. TaxID=1872578 RepID=UPI0035C6699A